MSQRSVADLALALAEVAPWASPALVTCLAQAVADAAQAWPYLSVPLKTFADHVAERWADAPPEPRSPALARDLYLACACAGGDEEAVRVLDREVLRAVAPAISQIRRDPDFVDEILQQARERLIVGPKDGRPRIAEYTGEGSLRGWVRVVVVRLALQAMRSREPAVPDGDGASDDGVNDERPEVGGGDPERDHIQRRYGGWFKRSIKDALAGLEGDDRRILEMMVRERLSLAEIGSRLGVNKSTVSRRVALIRERVFDEIQRRAREELRVAGGEYRSLLRLVQSRLDMSFDF